MGIENLDIKAFLTAHDISFKDRGKNVSRGWINLEVCPFCGDSSFHCGINLSSLGWHCWVCDEGKEKYITHLLKEMEIFKDKNIYVLVAPFCDGDIIAQPQEQSGTLNTKKEKASGNLHLPQGILDYLPEPHRNYLIGRNFDPDLLIKQYQLKAVYNTGTQKYRFRIIIPNIINGKVVSFVAAATLRKEGVVPYLNCTPEEAIIPVNACLYNIDSVKDIAVIVEGATDVWRMGPGFICTWRKGMTHEQILLLKKKAPKKVFILYDPDAIKQSEELANNICGTFPYVEILQLTNGDPGEQTFQEAMEIRQIIFN